MRQKLLLNPHDRMQIKIAVHSVRVKVSATSHLGRNIVYMCNKILK